RRFEEAKQDRNQDREEMNSRFEDAKQDMDRRFEEAKQDRNCQFQKVNERFEKVEKSINDLRTEMSRQFRWMIGLFAPLILGVVGLLVSNFLNLTR
ncbi:MAG: hypothetical protein QME81_03370, partial [bacterium]|nr:hypothetical protein [bacterium]